MKKFIATAVGSIVVYEYLKKKGVLDKLAGEIKDLVGDVSDDPKMELEGAFDKGKGQAKEFVSEAKDYVEDVKDDITSEMEE